MLTLTFEPLISPVLWLTVALAAVVTTAVYSWRRPLGMSRRRWWGIVGLMTSGWTVVLGVLLNPTWIEPVPPPAGKPLLTVLLDESASMGTNDVDGRSRFVAGAEIAQQIAAISNPVHGSPFEVQV